MLAPFRHAFEPHCEPCINFSMNACIGGYGLSAPLLRGDGHYER